MLRWMDKRQRIRFTDISTDEFAPDQFDRSMQDFMDEIQGRLPAGQWITGVEVFRRLYTAIGLGALVALTRVPGISHGLEAVYQVFAKNRLRLTGRCEPLLCNVDTNTAGSSKATP